MSKIKHIILAVAIAIVFAFFVGFGIATFYEQPEYGDFCEERFFEKPVPRALTGSGNCTYIEPDEDLKNQCKDKGNIAPKYDQTGCVESYFCETCSKEFEDVREVYNRNVFIVSVGIGIIALIIGFALHMPSVSSGLMGGGILTIIYGTIRFWGDLPDYGRFIILGIALIILIWLGYKKLKS